MKLKNEPVLDVLTGAFNQSEGKTWILWLTTRY